MAIWGNHLNGADLEIPEGGRFAKGILRRFRPVHLWISCECGPYSPLQRINQRTAEQKSRLADKQARARLQYEGALEVAALARKLGIHVHFELSERCEAWNLPMVVNGLQTLSLEKCTCKGCAVGLRTRDGKKALCKGWTIATSLPTLAKHMELRCQRNHPKGICEAGEAAHTARYTPQFARRVVNLLSLPEAWPEVTVELNTEKALPAVEVPDAEGGEDDEDMTDEERNQILRKIQHIHRATGHGSLKTLIRALEDRGVSQKVLAVAKSFSCPVCIEHKRPDPRRFATLEVLPGKWERVQIDSADWIHPGSRLRMHFVMMVDEGSRFRVARALFQHKTKLPNWEDIKTAYEELWLPHFGKPEVVRADPAGLWRSRAADQYFAERQVFLEPIVAEAHWRLGIAEGAIKSAKGTMTRLAEEYPEMSMHELLATATMVANKLETYRRYTPLQHAMGRNPDEFGRLHQKEAGVPVHPQLH